MSGWKDWAIGEVVTESEFQSFVQDQVVQVYDDATDRDNTLGANVAEGMMCYLKDIDETQVYDGTDWVQVGQGTITEVVAGTALTGGGTSGSVTLNVDESEITLAQSQVTDLVSDLSNKASTTHATTHESGGSDEIEIAQSQVTGLDAGTEGFTALSNGSSGLSYQPVSHNYIINGAFDNWQRGDSFTGLTAAQYTADRWRYGNFGGTSSVTKENFTPGELESIGFGGATHYLKFDVTSPDTFEQIEQRVEDVRTLAGQEVTISFWAKGVNPTGSADLQLRVGQVFSSDTNSTALNVGPVLTSSWQRFSYTFTFSSVSGKTITNSDYVQIRFLQANSIDSDPWELNLWGVQLEAGSIATPFKRNANSIAGELQACQRYYYVYAQGPEESLGTGTYQSTTSIFTSVKFPVTMRTAPSLDATSGSGIYDLLKDGSRSFDSFTISRARPEGCHLFSSSLGSGTVGTSFRLRAHLSGSKVAFSAEL